jgi:hypothetical protein
MSIIKCYKLKCQICGKEGTAQVWFGKTGELKFGRIRHYLRLNEAKKPVFDYHAQTKEYLMEKLKYIMPKIDPKVDRTQSDGDHKLKELSLVSKSTASSEGRSSSLVRTLALRAKGRRFESGSAHFIPLFELPCRTRLVFRTPSILRGNLWTFWAHSDSRNDNGTQRHALQWVLAELAISVVLLGCVVLDEPEMILRASSVVAEARSFSTLGVAVCFFLHPR